MSDPDQLGDIAARHAHCGPQPPSGAALVLPSWWYDLTDPEAEWLEHLHDDVHLLIAEVERLRGLLARLEWVYRDTEGRPSCPACGVYQGEPHDLPRCWLAAELKR